MERNGQREPAAKMSAAERRRLNKQAKSRAAWFWCDLIARTKRVAQRAALDCVWASGRHSRGCLSLSLSLSLCVCVCVFQHIVLFASSIRLDEASLLWGIGRGTDDVQSSTRPYAGKLNLVFRHFRGVSLVKRLVRLLLAATSHNGHTYDHDHAESRPRCNCKWHS